MDTNFLNQLFFIPFQEGGRDRSGSDCWGLVRICYQDLFGITLDEYSSVAYTSMSNLAITSTSISEIISDDFPFVEVDEPQYGDFVLVNMLGRPVHIGFMLSSDKMIHTSKQTGVAVENIRGDKWKRKIQSFHRHKSMLQQ